MSNRRGIFVLGGLLVVLGAILYYYFGRNHVAATSPAAAVSSSFHPLDVQEPQLRIDLLAKLQKLEYTGSHRNIFVAEPPSPPPSAHVEPAAARFVGPVFQPPPPVQVPGELFGYASETHTGRRVAFFAEGDDVLLVAEGATFLGRFRLIHVTDNSADVQEISSGRHATVPMVQPPPGQE
ncbi:MAG TPA: hypothetical protein VMB02_11080 [Candidatus Aquilonibacter sp.]|nr:hypothetical protein [Candidatus Aquilonibacter sp.]